MLNKNDEAILNRIKDILINTGIAESIILFGSRAYENNYNEQSDYDILVISHTPFDWEKQDRIYDLLYNVQLEYDVVLDIHFLARSEFETIRGKQPIFQKALKEGLSV